MNLRSIVYSVVIVFAIVIIAACQEDTYVSDAERIAAEERLFLQFLDDNYDAYSDSSVIIDTTYTYDTIGAEVFVDTIINRRVFGSKDSVDLVYWEKETGVGDTITSGQQIGYRYKLYKLVFNSETDSVDLDLELNQYDYSVPDVATIDQRNNQGYLTSYFGINEGLQHMKLNGKAWMLIPSSQTSGDYYTRFYEIEVVYIGR